MVSDQRSALPMKGDREHIYMSHVGHCLNGMLCKTILVMRTNITEAKGLACHAHALALFCVQGGSTQ